MPMHFLECEYSLYVLCALVLNLNGIEVGKWHHSTHGIKGRVAYDTPTQISISNFSYDGKGADAFLYYYLVGDAVGSINGNPIVFEQVGNRQDKLKFDREYVNEKILAHLPSGRTLCEIIGLAIWSKKYERPYALMHVSRPRFVEKDSEGCHLKGYKQDRNIHTNPPPLEYDNCVHLESQGKLLQLEWSVDLQFEEIDFKMCTCDAPAQSYNVYMAFGLSASIYRSHMIGGDVTVAWVDRGTGRPHAIDYFLQSKHQCAGGTGVCPDYYFTNDRCIDNIRHGSVLGGIRENGEVCVAYSRPLITNDSSCDIDFHPSRYQNVIWAIGGMINDPPDTVFKHYSHTPRGRRAINFGRTPLRRCHKVKHEQCNRCHPFKSEQMLLPYNATLYVKLGPSGMDRGYNTITGQPSWGNVAWYINNTLIPELVVRVGQTYTFIIEGGDDASESNYHPFYITTSKYGGILQKSKEDQAKETVYAGIDESGNPNGAGRRCQLFESMSVTLVRVSCAEKKDYMDYLLAKNPVCVPGREGRLTWTPDRATPRIVYYHSAQHRNLGWIIRVQRDYTKGAGSLTKFNFNIIHLLQLILQLQF